METALIPTGITIEYLPPFNGTETLAHAHYRLKKAHSLAQTGDRSKTRAIMRAVAGWKATKRTRTRKRLTGLWPHQSVDTTKGRRQQPHGHYSTYRKGGCRCPRCCRGVKAYVQDVRERALGRGN